MNKVSKEVKKVKFMPGDSFYIGSLEHKNKAYLKSQGRGDFFEIIWNKDEQPKLADAGNAYALQSDWMYLLPPNRKQPLKTIGKKGLLIAFDKSVLSYEVKEFTLDILKLFTKQGNFSTLLIDKTLGDTLARIAALIEEEYRSPDRSFLLLRTYLKAFLLKLISQKNQEFTVPDLNEKRIYQFFLLLENHFKEEKQVSFYAEKLNITSKRLNQILKEKTGKSISALLHERIIMEAKHELFISEGNIKEVALGLGFEDQSYFSRFFKRMTGQTPEAFHRKSAKKISGKRDGTQRLP
jgi:AraC family transcriptional activator of pobA